MYQGKEGYALCQLREFTSKAGGGELQPHAPRSRTLVLAGKFTLPEHLSAPPRSPSPPKFLVTSFTSDVPALCHRIVLLIFLEQDKCPPFEKHSQIDMFMSMMLQTELLLQPTADQNMPIFFIALSFLWWLATAPLLASFLA